MKIHAHGHDPAAAATKTDGAHTAAKQLEAFFLRRMLAEARPSGGGSGGAGSLDGGFAGDTFKQMFDEAIADKMSAAGGIGMAEMMAKQLSKGSGADNADAMLAKAGGAGVSGTGSGSGSGSVRSVGPLPEGYDGPALTMPVIGRPSSGYGMRADPVHGGQMKHPGFDLAAPTGTVVDAAAAGTVTHAGPAGTYGNLVTIKHASGYETRYAHLSAVSVHVGAHVDAGAQVGAVGTTGYSTGPHLHFEVRHDGQTIDPQPLLPKPQTPPSTNPRPGRIGR